MDFDPFNEKPTKKPVRYRIDEFRRPDGSVDHDALETSNVSPAEYEAIMRGLGYQKTDDLRWQKPADAAPVNPEETVATPYFGKKLSHMPPSEAELGPGPNERLRLELARPPDNDPNGPNARLRAELARAPDLEADGPNARLRALLQRQRLSPSERAVPSPSAFKKKLNEKMIPGRDTVTRDFNKVIPLGLDITPENNPSGPNDFTASMGEGLDITPETFAAEKRLEGLPGASKSIDEKGNLTIDGLQYGMGTPRVRPGVPAPRPVVQAQPRLGRPGSYESDPTLKGVVEGVSGLADRTLARYQALKSGGAASSSPPGKPEAAPQGASARVPRRPVSDLQSLLTGGLPRADTSAAEAELAAAQGQRNQTQDLAQLATGFGRAADLVQGTKTADPGAALRAQAGQPLDDLEQRRAMQTQAQKQALDEQNTLIDRAQMSAQEGRAVAAEGRTEEKAGRERDYYDGGSQRSANARAMAVSMYPQYVAKIAPAQFKSMSAADIDTLLKELSLKETRAAMGGARGMSPAQLAAIRKGLPPYLIETHEGLQAVDRAVAAAGGWDKLAVGFAGGLAPSLFVSKESQEARQQMGKIVSNYLQSGGGKAITSQEEKILIGSIAADPLSPKITPAMLKRGMEIIARSMANNTRQSLLLVPPEIKDQIAAESGIPLEWINTGAGHNVAATQAPQRRIARNPTTGERRYVNPDGSLGEPVK